MTSPSDPSPTPDTEPDPSGEASSPAGTPGGAAPAPDELVAESLAGLQEEAEVLRKLTAALAPLARPTAHTDPTSLERALEKAAARVEELAGAPAGLLERARAVLDVARGTLEEQHRRLRERLAPELRAACEARGLGLRVLRREEPVELRIPPLGVVVDRAKGRAEIRFARTAIATCPADAQAIVETHAQALSELDGEPFDPAAFFDACHRAWRAARASTGGGERVEILDFLPFLALELQPAAFRVDPTPRNYRGYSRVRFAWDVLRLRRAAGFTREGLRLNLGVATGTTATQKKRVIWFEDEQGEGEFKLTVFFTRAEGSS